MKTSSTFSTLRHVILISLSGMTGLSAQPGGQPQDPPPLSFRFRAMVWSGIGKNLFYVKDGEKIPFAATSANPSQWLSYRGPSPLLIYKEGETMIGEEGEPVPRPVAHFSPKNSKDYLLIFTSDPHQSPFAYQTFFLEEGDALVEEGLRIVNFTPSDIGIAINDDKVLMKTAEQRHLKPTANPDFSLQVTIASNTGEGWEIKYTNLLRWKPGFRRTLFISMPEDTIRIRSFLDRATTRN